MSEQTGVVRTARGTVTWDEIRDRVSVPADGVIMMREIADGSAEGLEALGVIAREKMADFDDACLIIDLTDAELPNASYRRFIVEFMRKMPVHHTAFIQANSALARTAALFMAKRAGIDVTVHKNVDDAVRACRTFLPK